MTSIPPTPREPKLKQCEDCGGAKFEEGMADRLSPQAWCECGAAHKLIKPSPFIEEDEFDRDNFYD